MKWSDVKKQIDGIDDHYSMIEPQHKLLFDYAMKVEKGGVVLELGVAHGKTAAMFMLVGQENGFEYVGVDDFSLEGTFDEVTTTLKNLNTTANWTLHNARTQDLAWGKQVDLLFIDAGHDEANVKPDCEKYVPFVKPGGVVIFDDWPQGDDDPHWAVGHYGTIATQGWEQLDDNNFIRAFRRPE